MLVAGRHYASPLSMVSPALHVGLNLIFAVPGESGGMEVAAREVIPHLAAMDGLRITLFVNREAAGTYGAGVEEVVVPVHAANRLEWVRGEQQHLPRLAAQRGVDIVHSLGSTAPLRGRFKRITTIHDLHYKLVPEAHFGVRGLGMRVLVPAAVRRSHRLLVDAGSTRDDLLEHLHVDPAKIDVVPLAVRIPDRVERRPEGFVLCVGAKRPHKNVVAVIEAIAGMDAKPKLVVTGYRSPYEAVLRERAAAVGVELELSEWVDDLDDLYARASVVAVPSLYEGFGLPVLEAMARGVPVVSSNRASLPEVAGDAALLVDPTDIAALRAAIEGALADPGPLSEKGRRRAEQFTWARTAELTVEAYRRA
jgi:glycosyltransferase involved in cell wall biosynthesis